MMEAELRLQAQKIGAEFSRVIEKQRRESARQVPIHDQERVLLDRAFTGLRRLERLGNPGLLRFAGGLAHESAWMPGLVMLRFHAEGEIWLKALRDDQIAPRSERMAA
jgi:hypothetical protein